MSDLLDGERRLAQEALSSCELLMFEKGGRGRAALREEAFIQACARQTKLLREFTCTRW